MRMILLLPAPCECGLEHTRGSHWASEGGGTDVATGYSDQFDFLYTLKAVNITNYLVAMNEDLKWSTFAGHGLDRWNNGTMTAFPAMNDIPLGKHRLHTVLALLLHPFSFHRPDTKIRRGMYVRRLLMIRQSLSAVVTRRGRDLKDSKAIGERWLRRRDGRRGSRAQPRRDVMNTYDLKGYKQVLERGSRRTEESV